ncbi:MAG TPA: hypothetical protein VGL53_00620 [Bryobacteraceae bacterium]|jgi:hypothetical protein
MEWVPISLDPDPVIEAFKKDVDRTLFRENLKLTPDERVRNAMAVARFVDEAREAGRKLRQQEKSGQGR